MQPEMTGFVPEPDGRGTTGIIWSCLVTVVLCTISALHLNVADHLTVKEFVWNNALAFIAPEIMLFYAILDLSEARSIINTARQHGISLTLCQAHLIDMGGVTIHKGKPTSPQVLVSTDSVLNALAVPEARALLPTDEQIRSRAKGENLSKLVTVGQLLWFTTQAIARLVQGKVVSLLEVTTLAFVFLAILSYLLWFKKPQGLLSPFVIRDDTPVRLDFRVERPGPGSDLVQEALLIISFVAFSGIHMGAWNYPFPSMTEKWLWRVNSLMLCILPTLAIVLWRPLTVEKPGETRTYTVFISMVGFVLVRIYLLVEVFLVFRRAPSSVYESVNWSGYFIHLW